MVHLHTVAGETPLPHVPVRLKLCEKPRQYRERVLKRVKQFPKFIPYGPHPEPPDRCTTEATKGLSGQSRIDALHAFMVDGIEAELADAYGIHGDERQAYVGRARKPQFVWRHAGGAPAAGDRPASNRGGRILRLLQRRLEDLQWAWHNQQRERMRTGLALANRDLETALDVAEVAEYLGEVRGMAGRWGWLIYFGCGTQMEAEVEELAERCRKGADAKEEEAASSRRKGFRDWARQASMAGGGAAHAFCKIPREWKAALVPGGTHPGGRVGQSSNPQEVVTAELSKWANGPWKANQEDPTPLPPWPVMARLQPILGEERDAAKTYSWRTGLGLEQLHPKHLTLLSDRCLFVLAFFLYSAEVAGTWAESMSYFSFFLLHKPTGGFRTIGLLSTFYRIWASTNAMRTSITRS